MCLGVEEGFGQACHGKGAPLARTRPGDWVIYYSPKQSMDDRTSSCKQFTAIGQVQSDKPYQVEQFPGFKPFRLNIEFDQKCKPVAWDVVKDKITFAPKLRFGFLEISEDEFKVLKERLLPDV